MESKGLLKSPSSSDVVGFLCNPKASMLGTDFIPQQCLSEPACSCSSPWSGLDTGPWPLSQLAVPGAPLGGATPGASLQRGAESEALLA